MTPGIITIAINNMMLTVIGLTGMAQPAVIRLTICSLAIRETLEWLLNAALRTYTGNISCQRNRFIHVSH